MDVHDLLRSAGVESPNLHEMAIQSTSQRFSMVTPAYLLTERRSKGLLVVRIGSGHDMGLLVKRLSRVESLLAQRLLGSSNL